LATTSDATVSVVVSPLRRSLQPGFGPCAKVVDPSMISALHAQDLVCSNDRTPALTPRRFPFPSLWLFLKIPTTELKL